MYDMPTLISHLMHSHYMAESVCSDVIVKFALTE